MARLLVQLKLRLLVNALRSSNRAKASFMVSTAFAVLTALGMFALLASLHGQTDLLTSRNLVGHRLQEGVEVGVGGRVELLDVVDDTLAELGDLSGLALALAG